MLGVVVSGVVILAFVALVAVALLLGCVVFERRRRAVEDQARFLNGLRRIQSRLGRVTVSVPARPHRGGQRQTR
jgi:hypothetical protein